MPIHMKSAIERISGMLLLIAVCINFLEIPLRIFLGFSFDLLFDFPVWITMWAALLIAGLLLREGEHISVDFIRNKIRGVPRLSVELFLALVSLGYGLLITYSSVLYVRTIYQKKLIFPKIVSIPQWIVQLCVPIGMGLLTVYAVLNILDLLTGKKGINQGINQGVNHGDD